MTYTYLDWNVFNQIEKKDILEEDTSAIFSKIERLIFDKKVICPYSNAHINDLLRGYSKNPQYISQHLGTLKRLTNNLCIVQYWGHTHITWHYRDVEEFFYSALKDKEAEAMSFTELLDWDDSGLSKKLFAILQSSPIPANFHEIYNANPIFNLLFPRTKLHMNGLALCEDLYDLSINLNKDYSIYHLLKSYINQSLANLKNHQEVIMNVKNMVQEPPKHLNLDEAWNLYSPKNRVSDNPAYHEITNSYIKLDFRGYKSDVKFPNLIDDSLHAFYGAHCDFFITIDDKCYHKALETYRNLNILTKVMKPQEFANQVFSQPET